MRTEEYPVLSGAESIFIQGNKIGIVLCHGFNGTPQSMQYLGKELSKKGYTVSIPRLKGHGTHYLDMEKSLYEDWIGGLQSAYNDLSKKCDKVFIVGQSMGGALTLQIAAKNKNVAGIFLINAAVIDVCYQQYQDKVEPQYIVEGSPDIKKEAVFEITYSKVPLKAIHQLLELMDDTKENIPSITAPTVVFKSTVDHVVAPENSDYIFQHINTLDKKMIELKHSYHVASMDYDAAFIVDSIEESIHSLSRPMLVKNSL